MVQQTRTYSLSYNRDEDGYLAYFPALPRCHTWAHHYEDVVERAEEALVGYLEALATRRSVRPSRVSRARRITLSSRGSDGRRVS